MQIEKLTDEELKIVVAGLGFALGFAIFVVLTHVIEEWVIACDHQDRERIREVLREMGIEPQLGHEKPQAKPRATVAMLTPRAAE
jgi:hypothetical protein